MTTDYVYDNMRRLTRLTDTGSPGVMFDRQYSYNSANQISLIAEPSLTRIFGYDNVDRLTSVTGGVTESYVLDGVGNRTSSHLSSSYSYTPFNRLTATQTANYAFDANGNTTIKSEGQNFWRYTWDFENRMVEASTRKTKARYSYDALGRRVQRSLGFAKENSKFTYDGLDSLIDDTNGTSTKYLNGTGLDNKLRQTTGSTPNYFLSDHQLSAYGLTGASGSLTASQTFDSYGNISNSSFPSRHQYTGREYDSFTGLYSYRARTYDANLGRFLSEDPAGFIGGTNLYAYVGNNPTQFTDPLGLFPWIWPFDYHQQITSGGLSGHASPREIRSVSWANQDFDRRTQDVEFANSHAMSIPGQLPSDARSLANDIVKSKICLARKYQSMGWHTDALHQIGEALHTVQDYESPAHAGFQVAWPNTIWEMAKNWRHYVKEIGFYDEDDWTRAKNNSTRIWSYYKGFPMPGDAFDGTGRSNCECR